MCGDIVQAPQRLIRAAARKDIHPELHKAKVICNGEEVLELTGTMPEYHVEVWSGNHPFYRGDTSALVVDEGQVQPTQLDMHTLSLSCAPVVPRCVLCWYTDLLRPWCTMAVCCMSTRVNSTLHCFKPDVLLQVNKFKSRFAGSALGDVVTLSESGAAASDGAEDQK